MENMKEKNLTATIERVKQELCSRDGKACERNPWERGRPSFTNPSIVTTRDDETESGCCFSKETKTKRAWSSGVELSSVWAVGWCGESQPNKDVMVLYDQNVEKKNDSRVLATMLPLGSFGTRATGLKEHSRPKHRNLSGWCRKKRCPCRYIMNWADWRWIPIACDAHFVMHSSLGPTSVIHTLWCASNW